LPNKYRSTFEIELNGVEYTLRPSFEAICQFNDITGMDVFDALTQLNDTKKLGVKIIASCIWAGIKGEYEFQGEGLKCPSYNKIGEECQKHGFPNCLGFAIDFLTYAVASDDDIKKFEEAGEPQIME
jgi:hypothetical protein